MPIDIDREEVQDLVTDGAQLVEVLSTSQYEKRHLSGAINIPLAALTDEAESRLERDQAVIVYCYDYQ